MDAGGAPVVESHHEAVPFEVINEVIFGRIRSLIATYQFWARIAELKEQGIYFSTYLYVPELDPVTKDIFHERVPLSYLEESVETHQRSRTCRFGS